MYEQELEQRRFMRLPPFDDVLKLTIKDPNMESLQWRIKQLFDYIKKINTDEDLWCKINNAPALIPRIANKYIWNIVIRWDIEKLIGLINEEYLKDVIVDRDPNILV